jgi:BBSome-interacting protein 1
MSSEQKPVLSEILPTKGLVFSERPGLSEVLCKPKILPIKSLALEKLERLEAAATQAATVDNAVER